MEKIRAHLQKPHGHRRDVAVDFKATWTQFLKVAVWVVWPLLHNFWLMQGLLGFTARTDGDASPFILRICASVLSNRIQPNPRQVPLHSLLSPHFPSLCLFVKFCVRQNCFGKLMLSPVTQVHDMHCSLIREVPRTTYLVLLFPVSALPKDWLL